LIEAGILGDDRREPEPTGEALEILFDSMTKSIDLDVARFLKGPIEWRFTDGDPWHIVVTNEHAEAKPGRAGNPALTLRRLHPSAPRSPSSERIPCSLWPAGG
jgi:hypothetical protein